MDATTAEAVFAAGKAAMMITGSWSIPTFTADESRAKDFSYFPFPKVTGGAEDESGYLYGGVANTLAISNSSEHREAAERFVKFMMTTKSRPSAVSVQALSQPLRHPVKKKIWIRWLISSANMYQTVCRALSLIRTRRFSRISPNSSYLH